MQALSILRLTRCDDLNDKGLASLQYLTGLTQLRLDYSPAISDLGVMQLHSLTRLRVLGLQACRQLTNQVICTLSAMSQVPPGANVARNGVRCTGRGPDVAWNGVLS